MSKYMKPVTAALGMLVLANADALAAGGVGGCTTTGCTCNGAGSTFIGKNHEPGDPSKPMLSMAFANDANDPGFDFAFHIIDDAEALAGTGGPDITVTGTLKTNKKGGAIGWMSPFSNVSVPDTDPNFCRRQDSVGSVRVDTMNNTYTAYLPQPTGHPTLVVSGYLVPSKTPPTNFCNTKGLAVLIIDSLPTCD